MSGVTQEEIEKVWADHHVERVPHDMTNECRLAAVIVTLERRLSAIQLIAAGVQAELVTNAPTLPAVTVQPLRTHDGYVNCPHLSGSICPRCGGR